MIGFLRFRLVFISVTLLMLCAPLRAQVADVSTLTDTATLTADALQNDKTIQLDKLKWKYHAGDDARWSDPQFDDAAWETLSATSEPQTDFAQRDWHGLGWFRLHLQVDQALAGQRLCLRAWHYGASEIYVDGQLVQRFGVVAASTETEQEFNPRSVPVPVAFNTGGAHTIAVRYSLAASADRSGVVGGWLARGRYDPEFEINVSALDDSIVKYAATELVQTRVTMMFVGILCALALLHFLLFLFYRRGRANLFYSIFALAFAGQILSGSLSGTGHHGAVGAMTFFIAIGLTLSLTFVSLLAFLHTAFTGGFNRYFWTVFAFWIVVTALRITLLRSNSIVFIAAIICISMTIAGMVLIMTKALREKREGAWIVMSGIQIFAFGMAVVLINEAHLVKVPSIIAGLSGTLAALAIPLSVSIYLAREVAQTNRNLEAQLSQVTELSAKQIEHERTEAELRLQHEQTRAENERRAKELEEARQLQFSMLPKKVPQLPNLEIAVYMKPATEVGGDYYDFHVGDDGTLTIAVGDATGHGLKAGTMVTAAKTLFSNLAHQPDIPQMFRQSSAALKKMNLRGLYMAMIMLKIKDRRMTISAAGMPSTLIYRAATRQVEEVVIRAMPLGSIQNFPYKQQELNLFVGDVIVLMSDGFPEMFNEQGEMLDYDKAKALLQEEAANHSAQWIINRFVEVGDEWAGTRAQDDDVTFVVLKVKNETAAV